MICCNCSGSGFVKCENEICLNPRCTYLHCVNINGVKYHDINYKICNACNGSGVM